MDTIGQYQPYAEGDAVELMCYYWAKGTSKVPSEYTGRIAIILENYSPDEMFFKEKPEGKISLIQWNNSIAKDLWYKVMIGKRILECNHLCFVEKTIQWSTANIGEKHYARF